MYGPLKKYADSISQKDIDEMLHIKKELMKKFHVSKLCRLVIHYNIEINMKMPSTTI